jgi:hypothetical protein
MNINSLLTEIVTELKQVEGVSAVVLGGSRARGTHTPKSDIDLGIYYHPDRPLDLEALNQVATHFDDGHRVGILTPLGGWGPWINGGGWLTVQSIAVDFLYRDLKKVAAVVEACHQGQVEIAYQPGHPFGFLTSIYMGEIALCQLLWESERCEVSALKARTSPFPAALKQALIDKFTWEIDFSLGIGRKAAARGDVTYAAGCCFRAANCLLQVLFAINETYWMNEKGAVALAETFPLRPERLKTRIETAFATLSAASQSIDSAIDLLAELATETNQISESR